MAAGGIARADDGTPLAGERWGAGAPVVVLLHAGVADRRAWGAVAPLLPGTVVAYDRRGFGETPLAGHGRPWSHLDDLVAVLDAVAPDGAPAWLVGNSMGGALAVDAALARPERVAGLVLVAPAVSGAPEPGADELDPATRALADAIDAAFTAGDLDAVNRVETRLWLDGPASPEGRVGGGARELVLAMNGVALAAGGPEDAGESGVDAWARLEEVRAPTTVVLGALDVPAVNARGREVSERIPGATLRMMPGVAHLPGVERPQDLAALVRAAIA